MLEKMTLAAPMLAAALLIQRCPAGAAPGFHWCSQFDRPSPEHGCSFRSWEQCMETMSGVGGYCYVNPFRPPPARPQKRGRPAVRR
jgi:hypothetical protein